MGEGTHIFVKRIGWGGGGGGGGGELVVQTITAINRIIIRPNKNYMKASTGAKYIP